MSENTVKVLLDLARREPKIAGALQEAANEIERLRQANENNLAGWSDNVAGLQRKIVRLEEEAKANASMLAKQCDLAREAETESTRLKKEVKDHAEWARRVATDPEFVPAREIIKELAAVENEVKRLIDQEIKIKSLEAEAKRLSKENSELKVCLEGANQVVLSSAREAEALAAKVEELQSARERDGSEMRETLKFEANLQKMIAQVRFNAGKDSETPKPLPPEDGGEKK